jgi:hypothetical protein
VSEIGKNRVALHGDRMLQYVWATMWLRKVSGLLLTLTMAHLAVAGNDLVCARHAGGHHAAAETAMPGMDHHGLAGDQAPEKPCNAPARSDCCEAVTTCAAAISLGTTIVSLEPAAAEHARPISADEVLLSRLIPPDPPPPKV